VSEENQPLVDAARDRCKFIVKRILPRVIRWFEALDRFGGA
jgi:hypothetical protein